MTNFVSAATIVELVKRSGSDAVIDGEMLKIYPKNGRPVCYLIPADGFAGRIVGEIAKRTDIATHIFFNPTRSLPQEAPSAAPVVTEIKRLKVVSKKQSSGTGE